MDHVVVAELVGVVLSVAVGEDAVVEAGDIIAVLESMKMEIPVLTEYAGVVKTVAVREGEVVHEGDVLAVVDAGGQ